MGQKFNGGLFGGLSSSQIRGDRLSGFDLTGFNGGFFTGLDLSEKSSVQFEISFVQKGSRELPSDTSNFYKARLNYISMPLFYRYRYGKLGFEVGPVFDVLVSSAESDQSGVYDSDPAFSNFNLAGFVGVSYHFNENWWVSFRSVSSITAIRTPEVDRPNASPYLEFGQRNIALTFAVYFSFFGPD